MESSDLKITIAKELEQIKAIQDQLEKAEGTPSEGELLSSGNRAITRLLEDYGVSVAQVEKMARDAEDYYGQIREQKFQHFNETNAIEKSKSLAKTDSAVKEALKKLRDLQYSADVLERKQRSLYAFLDHSRSRLSWVSKDRSNV